MSTIHARFVLLAFVASCSVTKPNPLSCADGFCSDQAHPFCDVDGSLSGKPGLCVAVACTPNQFESCRGDEALTCNDGGTDFDVAQCEFGCGTAGCFKCEPDTATCDGATLKHCTAAGIPGEAEACAAGCIAGDAPHCAHLEPRFLPDVCDAPATAANLTINSAVSFDTGLDINCNGGVVAQPDGPAICVVRYGTIAIDTPGVITVVGPRALALVADRSLTIAGTVDISANGLTSGPGGGRNAATTSGGAGDIFRGGGGSGFKTAGASGGFENSDEDPANAGLAADDPDRLYGGAQSAETAFPTGAHQAGGGGGAMTAIACRGQVTMSGLIDAGGGGGKGGVFNALGGSNPSGGGGAGGFVALQGMTVAVTGKLYANGGGGGAGYIIAGTVSHVGSDGTRSSTAGAPGATAIGQEGAGGTGGRKGAAPTRGVRSTSSDGGGGGGGSTGVLQVYAPTGVTPALNASDVSPAFEAPRTTATR